MLFADNLAPLLMACMALVFYFLWATRNANQMLEYAKTLTGNEGVQRQLEINNALLQHWATVGVGAFAALTWWNTMCVSEKTSISLLNKELPSILAKIESTADSERISGMLGLEEAAYLARGSYNIIFRNSLNAKIQSSSCAQTKMEKDVLCSIIERNKSMFTLTKSCEVLCAIK